MDVDGRTGGAEVHQVNPKPKPNTKRAPEPEPELQSQPQPEVEAEAEAEPEVDVDADAVPSGGNTLEQTVASPLPAKKGGGKRKGKAPVSKLIPVCTLIYFSHGYTIRGQVKPQPTPVKLTKQPVSQILELLTVY